MDGGEAYLLAQAICGLEIGIRLVGEAGDDVGGDRHVGNELANEGDGAAETFGRVAAAHEAEDGIGPALEGEVEVGAEAGVTPQP